MRASNLWELCKTWVGKQWNVSQQFMTDVAEKIQPDYSQYFLFVTLLLAWQTGVFCHDCFAHVSAYAINCNYYLKQSVCTYGSGVYIGLELCRMYWVEWKTRKASPARKSREERRPATGRKENPVHAGRIMKGCVSGNQNKQHLNWIEKLLCSMNKWFILFKFYFLFIF